MSTREASARRLPAGDGVRRLSPKVLPARGSRTSQDARTPLALTDLPRNRSLCSETPNMFRFGLDKREQALGFCSEGGFIKPAQDNFDCTIPRAPSDSLRSAVWQRYTPQQLESLLGPLDDQSATDRFPCDVFTMQYGIRVTVSLARLKNSDLLMNLGLHAYHAPHAQKSPYIVAAEVYYAYLNHIMKMKRVHEQGFVDLIDMLYSIWNSPPPDKAARHPVLKFPVKLFRWGFLVFTAHQKRRYAAWCPRCGPYLRGIVLDVCCGIRSLRRTCDHVESEVRVHLIFLSHCPFRLLPPRTCRCALYFREGQPIPLPSTFSTRRCRAAVETKRCHCQMSVMPSV